MLKKRLHIALNIILCYFTAGNLHAQFIANVPSANIIAQSPDFTFNVNGAINTSVALLTTYRVKTSGNNFISTIAGSTATMPVGLTYLKVNFNTSLGVIANGSEAAFDPNDQPLYSSVLSVISGTPIFNFRLVTAGKSWLAGSYATTLTFTPSNWITPASQVFTLNVPSFITQNLNPALTTLSVNSLSLFTNTTGVSGTNAFNYHTTVPTNINLKTANVSFAFTTSYNSNQSPVNSNSLLNAQITTPASTGPVITMAQTDNALNSSPLNVTTTNRNDYTVTYNVNAANLSSNFVQAGVYTLPVTYTVATAGSFTPAATAASMSSSVQVVVDNMSNMSMVNPNVSMGFTTAANYAQGITVQRPGHVNLSSTVPYSVTVKASSDFLTFGSNQIPVSVIRLEGIPDGNGLTPILPITLSSTAQPIVSTANPVIGRLLDLQYRIPATQTSNLVGKQPGAYTTTITYTLVAP